MKSLADVLPEGDGLSPSLGREWIEIRGTKTLDKSLYVSLLGEGVD